LGEMRPGRDALTLKNEKSSISVTPLCLRGMLLGALYLLLIYSNSGDSWFF